MLGLLITVGGRRVLLFNLHPVMPTLILNLIVYIVVSKLTRRPSEAIQERFYDEVDQVLRAGS